MSPNEMKVFGILNNFSPKDVPNIPFRRDFWNVFSISENIPELYVGLSLLWGGICWSFENTFFSYVDNNSIIFFWLIAINVSTKKEVKIWPDDPLYQRCVLSGWADFSPTFKRIKYDKLGFQLACLLSLQYWQEASQVLQINCIIGSGGFVPMSRIRLFYNEIRNNS